MNIALTISRLTGVAGGAQKSIVELANEMVARGHKVTLISIESDVSIKVDSFYKTEKAVDVRKIIKPRLLSDLHVDKNDRPRGLTDKAFDEFEWYALHQVTIVELVDVFIDLRPDVVVSFLPSTFTLTSIVLKDTGIPLVIANRNDPVWDYSIKRYMSNGYDVKLRKDAVRTADLNLVQIPAFTDYFSQEVRKKTNVIPNAVQLPRGELIPEESRDNIIISVGRLEEIKNHQLLINAFAKIASKNKAWEVHIYGDGSLRRVLQSSIDAHALTGRVILKGVTDNISTELARAKIFALPSHIEGFSRALSEAMAHGTPSIVLKQCVSNNFLVTDSKGGVAAENTVTDFSKKLQQLIEGRHDRLRMSRSAQQYIGKYNPKSVYDKWESVLLGVVDNSSGIDHKRVGDSLMNRRVQLLLHYGTLLGQVVKLYNKAFTTKKQEVQKAQLELGEVRNSKPHRLSRRVGAIIRLGVGRR